ncbi:MAG: hypothetical protein ACYDEY_07725 [Acidimicrobiales bacterium]
MGYETEKMADAKRRELQTLIAGALQGLDIENPEHLADEVVQHFADVTAPYWESTAQLMTVRSGGMGGGSTTKPGNVLLNIGKLIRAIATGTLTIVGAMTAPWTLLLGALVTWDALWSCLTLKISEDHACVIWTLWNGRDNENTIAKADVLGAVNRERSRFGKQPLSAQEVDRALDELVRMRCVQQSKNDANRWWLREWVNIKY